MVYFLCRDGQANYERWHHQFSSLADRSSFSLLREKECKVIAQNEICRNRTGKHGYPLSGYINPLPEHLVPIALHTVYTVCQTYIYALATGLSSLNYPIHPIQQHPYAMYDQYVLGPPQAMPHGSTYTLLPVEIYLPWWNFLMLHVIDVTNVTLVTNATQCNAR